MSAPSAPRAPLAFAAGVALGAAAAGAIAYLRRGAGSASKTTTTTTTLATADARNGTTPALDSAEASGVEQLQRLVSEKEEALSLAQQEVDGLLALLRSKEEALSALEGERSKHSTTMAGIYAEIEDVRAVRDSVQQLQARVRELEAQLEQAKAAGFTTPGPDLCVFPHDFPLATPATAFPPGFITSPNFSVLFDLDGTLVESGSIWYELLNSCSQSLGYGELAYERWLPTFGQSMQKNRELFFPRHEQAVIDQYCDKHYGEFIHHLHVLPGAIDSLRATAHALRHVGGKQRMAICTNCPLEITKLMIRAIPELVEFFGSESEGGRIVCAGSVVRVQGGSAPRPLLQFNAEQLALLDRGEAINYTLQAKPSTDIIQYAAFQLDAPANAALFVGDSKFDLISSMAAHCFAFGIGDKGKGGNMHVEDVTGLKRVLEEAERREE